MKVVREGGSSVLEFTPIGEAFIRNGKAFYAEEDLILAAEGRPSIFHPDGKPFMLSIAEVDDFAMWEVEVADKDNPDYYLNWALPEGLPPGTTYWDLFDDDG